MKILGTLIVIAITTGCSGRNQERSIADVTEAEKITLTKARSQGHIHYLTVAGKGHIDGTAEIVLLLGGKPHRTEKLSGSIDFQWHGEWYSNTASVEYKPASVDSGSLNLEYKFKDR